MTNRLDQPAHAVPSPNAARYNLRDYGGYATAGGGRLRKGSLFRSGQLDDALPEDWGLLARLGIGSVIDLRSAFEGDSASSVAYAGFAGDVLVAGSEDGVIPHAVASLIGLSRADDVAAKMTDTYRALPRSDRFRESLGLYFGALAGDAESGGTLIHCFAGKDRTGLAVALFHIAMGVHMDDVMADYLLTNDAGEERIAAGIAVLRRQAVAGVSDMVLREAMGVRPEYLTAALEVIAADSESPAAWVLQATGLDSDKLETIAARLQA